MIKVQKSLKFHRKISIKTICIKYVNFTLGGFRDLKNPQNTAYRAYTINYNAKQTKIYPKSAKCTNLCVENLLRKQHKKKKNLNRLVEFRISQDPDGLEPTPLAEKETWKLVIVGHIGNDSLHPRVTHCESGGHGSGRCVIVQPPSSEGIKGTSPSLP